MTPRFIGLFSVTFAVVLLVEWFTFLSGFPMHLWSFGSWMLLLFVLAAEALAVAIITMAVDKALPAAGNRALTRDIKQSRRGSQRYTPR